MRVTRKQKNEQAKSRVPHDIVHNVMHTNLGLSTRTSVSGDRENASMYTKDHAGESSNATRNEVYLALGFACDIKTLSELKRYCKVGSGTLNNAQCHQGVNQGMHNVMSAR